MKRFKEKKLIISLVTILIILIVAFSALKNSSDAEKGGGPGYSGATSEQVQPNTQPAQIVPLTEEQVQSVAGSIVASGVLNDIPEENPIGLVFYEFADGQRVWRSGLLMGNNQFLSDGEPKITVIMHSKYISEMGEKSLCEVIGEANKNGDFAIESEGNKALLLIKYSKLLKYKDCLG